MILLSVGRRITTTVLAMNTARILKLEERLNKSFTLLTSLQHELVAIKEELRQLHRPPSKIIHVNDEDDSDSTSTKKTKYSFDVNPQNGHVIVYTDGACESNGQKSAKAGIGVWFGDEHPLNVSAPCPGRQTNNTAEILACAEACKIAAANGVDKLQINTDSQFVINCVTKWMSRWKQNNWKTSTGKAVINKEDLLILEQHSNALSNVHYNHVKGHSGDYGNTQADRLAVLGALKSN